jgi:uncharacterized protein
VRQLGGNLPTRIGTSRPVETTDTRENTFVAAVLRLCAEIVRRYAQAVRYRSNEGSGPIALEASGLLDSISCWLRHPVLATTTPRRSLSVESAVLLRRPGYREVTAFVADLQSRTAYLAAEDSVRLLEARDAALIYEYWCFLEVVDAVSKITGADPAIRFDTTPFSARIGEGTEVKLGNYTVWFNRQFVKRSYSVPLRPDISLETPDGVLHLFDAKFKHDPVAWMDAGSEDGEDGRTYRRGDLYKMHTYRDALDASTVWVLYPGKRVGVQEYTAHDGVGGVGAIPLTPGMAGQHSDLRDKIVELLDTNYGHQLHSRLGASGV